MRDSFRMQGSELDGCRTGVHKAEERDLVDFEAIQDCFEVEHLGLYGVLGGRAVGQAGTAHVIAN
jgi:hypothetical protein